MIQIHLKAKHLYFIVYHLQDNKIREYYYLFNRIKDALIDIESDDDMVTVDAHHHEITRIFTMLSNLSEGKATMINDEMYQLFNNQIMAGIMEEVNNGLVEDETGVLPEDAYWQRLAASIQFIRSQNINARDWAISEGKKFIIGL